MGERAGVAGRARDRGDRAKERLRALRADAERRFPVITELTTRLLSADLLDAATRMAAQIFLTAVPLLFAFAAFAPHSVRDQLLSSLRTVLGVNGAADEQLRQVVNSGAQDNIRETSGLVGLLMALLSATACSRAMARVCERAWLLPKASTRIAAWRWFAWLGSWLIVLLFQGPLRDGFGAGYLPGLPLTFLAALAVWWWTQHLLLSGRMPWIPLLPGALLCAIAMTALSVTARLYIPRALNRAIAEYGSLGAVLTILSWLIAICAALTFAITAGAVLAQEPPLDKPLGTPESVRVGQVRR